jgi:hypothetical protein
MITAGAVLAAGTDQEQTAPETGGDASLGDPAEHVADRDRLAATGSGTLIQYRPDISS